MIIPIIFRVRENANCIYDRGIQETGDFTGSFETFYLNALLREALVTRRCEPSLKEDPEMPNGKEWMDRYVRSNARHVLD